MFVNRVIEQINIQKKELGISNAIIAEQSGVSVATVARILSGNHPSAHFDHVYAIASVLGVSLVAQSAIDPEIMKREQAEKKAKQIMKLVRGNSALEATETSQETYQRMLNKTINELMAGPKRALWA